MTDKFDSIPFHGQDLLAVQIDGKPFIVLKPPFEHIGLAANKQIERIQKQAWACTTVTVVQVAGQRRNMIAADLRTFLMALATIPASRVKPEVRPLLEAYQSEVADVIEAYYAKGMAPINPRVEPEQVAAVMDRAAVDYRSARERLIAEEQAQRLASARVQEAERSAFARVSAEQVRLIEVAVGSGLLDPDWGRTKIQVIVGRGLGETPQIEQKALPLYVEDFMTVKGVPRAKVARFSGAFGKKILAQAAAEGMAAPGKRIQELPDGNVREVTAWTREHLPLFERAWSCSYEQDDRLKP